ncbi:hypothetical protein DBR06_SOUSAS11710004, partial [Sousa chinensis]
LVSEINGEVLFLTKAAYGRCWHSR